MKEATTATGPPLASGNTRPPIARGGMDEC